MKIENIMMKSSNLLFRDEGSSLMEILVALCLLSLGLLTGNLLFNQSKILEKKTLKQALAVNHAFSLSESRYAACIASHRISRISGCDSKPTLDSTFTREAP